MDKKLVFTVVIPERFIDSFEEFEQKIEHDPDFKEALENLDNRYKKKTKFNVFRSAKIRFLISKYLTDKENA